MLDRELGYVQQMGQQAMGTTWANYTNVQRPVVECVSRFPACPKDVIAAGAGAEDLRKVVGGALLLLLLLLLLLPPPPPPPPPLLVVLAVVP
ncbi:hypothetical protein JKP88DRAFT_348507 [Tribonema minus]|uniref:Uncharacterized protein n=1 Tax=Tribonema minus TaxID=303371 RepID=A0A836CFY6_9STRA|nr:hypothetical protein JKP88DRAFT_348507 [Tribonema minus]